MAAHDSPTHKWLRQNTQPYAAPDIVFADVSAVLARYPTVRPKTDVYTYDDGRTQLLLCLHGLLPIAFRGASYNIPVAVWLTRDYPRQPPIAYVVPTADMLVRSGPDMDVSGKCLIQYLHNWELKHEGCNLTALFDAMQATFSRLPPVYAKPKPVPAPQPHVLQPQPARALTTGSDYSDRPPPPLPPAHASTPPQSAPPAVVPTRHDERPPLPAKPGTSAVTATTTPHARMPNLSTIPRPDSRSQSPTILATPTLAMRPRPPLPPHSPAEPPLRQQGNSPVLPTYSPRIQPTQSDVQNFAGAQARLPVPQGAPTPPRPTPPPAARAFSSPPPLPPLPPLQNVVSPIGAPQPMYPTFPMGSTQLHSPAPAVPPPFISPQPPGSPHAYRAAPPPAPHQPGVPFQPIRASPAPAPPAPSIPPPDLLDDDAGASGSTPGSPPPPASAPPRPPNPELLRLHASVHARVTSELASLSHALALDAERLRAHQTDLLAGEPAIHDEMGRLQAVRDVCRGVATRLRVVVEQGERAVAELRRKGDPEVDELVCSTTIVYNQLINLVAEDNAIEDTIYHLHRGLNTGCIDLERFLRTTRVLAEEQFMKRALMEKIQTGLPPHAAAGPWGVVPDFASWS